MNTTGNEPTSMEHKAANAHVAEHWLNQYGDFLFRQALIRVRHRQTAEDLVQEVFLAAWKSRDRFAHRSSERTWLFSILRNKIVDYYRKSKPEVSLASDDDLTDFENSQFSRGALGGAHWTRSVAPRHWSHPRQSLERSEFWQTISQCVSRLPDKLSQVFVWKELDELETADICHRIGVTPAHLFVMLHRARLGMRRCLELTWFRSASKEIS